MSVQDSVAVLQALAPIVAAVAGIITVYFSRTIHALVNSAMTAVKADLQLANNRIADLQSLVIVLSKERKVEVTGELMIPPPVPPTVAKIS